MYPLHPLSVHLPIGLLLGNALLTALYLRRRDRGFEIAAYHCLWLGWLFTLPAVALGTFDAVRLLYWVPNPRDDALGWINAHAIIGLAIVIVYWQAWQVRRRNPAILDDQTQRGSYLMRLGLGVAFVVLDGWLGGYLVYGLQLGKTG